MQPVFRGDTSSHAQPSHVGCACRCSWIQPCSAPGAQSRAALDRGTRCAARTILVDSHIFARCGDRTRDARQGGRARGATECVGIDSSENFISLAQPVADAFPGRVKFTVGDAQQLPFADATFDAVTMGFLLLHLPEPELALKEAFRVLKPGGKLAFSVWKEGAPGFDPQRHRRSRGRQRLTARRALPFFHFADPKNAAAALVAASQRARSHMSLCRAMRRLPTQTASSRCLPPRRHARERRWRRRRRSNSRRSEQR